MDNHLETNDLESPHVEAFVSGNQLHGVFVLGDTVHNEVLQQSGIMCAALTLLCTYYLLYLQYPRPYSMLLAAFQEFIIEEPYKRQTSKGFKTFQSKFIHLSKSCHRKQMQAIYSSSDLT